MEHEEHRDVRVSAARLTRLQALVAIAVVAVTLGVLALERGAVPLASELRRVRELAVQERRHGGAPAAHEVGDGRLANPPLFFAAAGQIERAAKSAGFTTPGTSRPVSERPLRSRHRRALGLIARELFPGETVVLGRGPLRGRDHARARAGGCAVSPGAARHVSGDGRSLRRRPRSRARRPRVEDRSHGGRPLSLAQSLANVGARNSVR